jgi:hypothetical protein
MNILLNEALLASKHISHAGIVRVRDGAVKAKSIQFTVSFPSAFFLKTFTF